MQTLKNGASAPFFIMLYIIGNEKRSGLQTSFLHLAFYGLNQNVNNLDVNFLNSVGITEMRHSDFNVSHSGQPAAVLTGKNHGFNALGLCRFHCSDYVL